MEKGVRGCSVKMTFAQDLNDVMESAIQKSQGKALLVVGTTLLNSLLWTKHCLSAVYLLS